MAANPLVGNLVRLCVFDPEKDSEALARWNRDSEYQSLLSSGPSYLWTTKQVKEWSEKHQDDLYSFGIHILGDDRLIGTTELSGIDWVAGNCWVGIGIGERELWGKGYGTEAMDLIVRYAFESLNLKRVSLTVFQYNERAVKSYLKVGFVEEGRFREWMQRRGARYDLIFMGLLRSEWEERQEVSVSVSIVGQT
jgi:RimJ/RimL family protein N-acetyltransferase